MQALPWFSGPLRAEAFSYGQSNPTYKLTSPTGSLVLRKKPAGKLAQSAHAIHREFMVLQALQGDRGVPVPVVHVYCSNESIIGTPFYIMEFVAGRVFTDPALPSLQPAQRSAVYAEAVRVLQAIHSVDIAACGLQRLNSSRGTGYYGRQLRRLTSVAQQQAEAAGPLPHLELLSNQLQKHTPPGMWALYMCTCL